MRVLDLFAGAGGAALGLHAAGFRHLYCVERDAYAAATLRAAGLPALETVVRTPDYAALRGHVDLLWASPPCQAWSVANQRPGLKGADDIARNGWPWTLDVVRAVEPRWAVFENVRNARAYVDTDVTPVLRTMFPFVDVWTLNAADHGVPQSRTRIIVVAGPRAVEPPAPQPRVTMREAIGVPWDRPAPCVMTNEWKGRPREARWWRKLNNASDALALATNGGRLKLRLDECALLQSFPPDHPFHGPLVERYRQVGNAVPPRLAQGVGRQVLRAELRG
jgi:DNA (cytosine-5)-methyltransferase 1